MAENIKITNAKIFGLWGLDIPGPLQRILTLDLEIKTSYWLSKLGVKIEKEIKLINIQRSKLIEKYKDEQTPEQIEAKELTKISPGKNLDEFNKQFLKILDMETTLDIKKIDISLKDNKDVKLSAADIMMLDDVINIIED